MNVIYVRDCCAIISVHVIDFVQLTRCFTMLHIWQGGWDVNSVRFSRRLHGRQGGVVSIVGEARTVLCGEQCK